MQRDKRVNEGFPYKFIPRTVASVVGPVRNVSHRLRLEPLGPSSRHYLGRYWNLA